MANESGPTSTQADLDKLGYTSKRLKDMLNDMRSRTLTEVHLNDQFCTNYQWRLQNVMLGPPVMISRTPIDLQSVSCIQQYDNSRNRGTTIMDYSEQRVNILQEDLRMESPAKIRLATRVELPPQVAGLDLPPELRGLLPLINTEEATGDAGWMSEDGATVRFEIRVPSGEAIELRKIVFETGSMTVWEVPYGFEGRIGTHGGTWRNSEDWGFSFDSVFTDPSQKMKISLRTTLTKVTYQLKTGKAAATSFRTADWHPTSTVIVTNTRKNMVHEYQLGETIVI